MATEATEAMIEAGVDRLRDLLQAGVSSAYIVEEVFKAMLEASPPAYLTVDDTTGLLTVRRQH